MTAEEEEEEAEEVEEEVEVVKDVEEEEEEEEYGLRQARLRLLRNLQYSISSKFEIIFVLLEGFSVSVYDFCTLVLRFGPYLRSVRNSVVINILPVGIRMCSKFIKFHKVFNAVFPFDSFMDLNL